MTFKSSIKAELRYTLDTGADTAIILLITRVRQHVWAIFTQFALRSYTYSNVKLTPFNIYIFTFVRALLFRTRSKTH